MKTSPINISVHTTNPELRIQMMKNKRAGEVLSYLRRFADAGISLNCQIVLCKGVNDGAELGAQCATCFISAVALGVAIVPAGLTDHRDGLYKLEPYTPDEAAE